MRIRLSILEELAIATFLAIFIITIFPIFTPGDYLGRLMAIWNDARRFLGLRDGLFLLLIIPGIVAAEAAYKALIKYQPLSEREKIVVSFLVLGLIVGAISGYSSPSTDVAFDEPVVHHVIVVTFDGTRAEVFRQATARIQEMKEISARAEYAISTYPTITYPSHTTMFTGASYVVHGVLDNAYYEVKAETIFQVLSEYGMKNAIITPASTLAGMLAAKSGYAPTSVFTGERYADMSEVTDKAIELLDQGYSFIRMHYVESDEAGHLFGADSDQYRSVIAAQQMELKRLVDHLNETGLREDTVIIVTADHGMRINKHHHIRPGFVDHVPFIIMGGKVRPMELKGVSTIDIAPTVAMLLGVRVPAQAQGVAIGEPFGLENVRCDTGSLKANLAITAIAVALLRTSLLVVLYDRILKRFF